MTDSNDEREATLKAYELSLQYWPAIDNEHRAVSNEFIDRAVPWLITELRKAWQREAVMRAALEEIRQFYTNDGEPTIEHENAEEALSKCEGMK